MTRADGDRANRVTLFGVRVSRSGLHEAVEQCHARIRDQHGGYVCFVNVHTLTESTVDPSLNDALTNAAFCFADGLPVVWLSTLKQSPIEERVGGPDFMTKLIEVERDRVHGFVGGAPDCADRVAQRYGVKAVTYSPPMREFSERNAAEDWQAFIDRCPDRKAPALVWVGLGAPKQERWLRAVSSRAPNVLFFGVGAAFDFLSGSKRRAPRWMQRSGLEWAYRLSSDPRRLWKRYLISNSRFAVLSLRELLASRTR